ncbi:MAG: hypothetical protein JNL01_02795 [Bdellovibrionales bacterium]|nr:hypothetical protein [Bdellovibrionales bacterium]
MGLVRFLTTTFFSLLLLQTQLKSSWAQDADVDEEAAVTAASETVEDPDRRPKAPPKGSVKVFLKDPKAPNLIQGITVNEAVDVKVGEEVKLAPAPSPSPSKKGNEKSSDEDAEGEAKPSPSPGGSPSPDASAPPEPPLQMGAGSSANPIATVDGNFDRKGWQLFYGEDTLWLTRDKKFKLELPVYAQETEFEIVARGKGGEEEKSRYVLQFENWYKFSGDPRVRRGVKKDGLWVGGSLGTFGYTETRANPSQNKDASQLALSVWGQYRRTLAPKWDGRGELTFTLLPFGGKPSGFRYLAVGLYAGYELYKNKDWQVHAVAGPRHLRMMTDGSFGVSNVTGFRLFPTVTHKLSNGSTIQGYVGYSSVSLYYGAFPSGSNSELTIGFSYDFNRAKPAKPIRVHLDYSSLSLDVDDAVLSASTLTLGASMPIF